MIQWNILAMVAGLIGGGTGLAQMTAFTYQGRLNDGGTPANGNYDISFAAYDAVTNGNLISALVTNSAVAVSNGLFTTTVDFGNGVFTGGNLWLEMAVRANDANAFSIVTPRQQFTPTPYALYAANSGQAAGAAPGALVTSLNTLKDDVTLAAGTNVTITPNGNTLTISSAGVGGSGIWSVNGNNAFYTAGKVGIGTNSPKGALHVASGGVAVTGASSPYIGAGAGVFLESFGATGGLLFGFDYSANSPLNLLLNSPGGNVGIGTLSPSAKLTVYDSASVSHRIETGGDVNAWTRVEFANGNGQWDVGTSRGYNGDQLYFYREGAAASALALQPNGDATFGGDVILSGTAAVSHRIQTTGGVNSWTRLELANGNGQWDLGTSRGYNGDQLYFYREGAAANAFAVQPNGDGAFLGSLAVGTGSPTANLDVRGSGLTESTVYSTGERAILSLHSHLGGSDHVWTLESGLFGTPGLFGIYDRTAGQSRMTIDTGGNTYFGGPNVSVCTLSIRGGCDLAEPFAVSGPDLEKGSVVVIDPEHPGQLKLSTQAYDRRVAGVISGANGINPGIAMHQEGALEGGQNVALSGRVYVLADASNGSIEPGDLLTTSSTPGHAMKVSDHARARGAALGKAMTGLAEGRGMVLMLVSPQ